MIKSLVSGTILGTLMMSVGCVSNQVSPESVDGFKKEKYLGKWYEIARFDHSFERGLNNVSANYSLRDNGTRSKY